MYIIAYIYYTLSDYFVSLSIFLSIFKNLVQLFQNCLSLHLSKRKETITKCLEHRIPTQKSEILGTYRRSSIPSMRNHLARLLNMEEDTNNILFTV